MKAYAIRDRTIDRNRDLAWLLYYEKTPEFHIEISSLTDEWEAPLILSSYVKRGLYSVGTQDSLLWVRQRIVPPDRQNLGMILKENGLAEYDEYRLLAIADGRCAQDECYIAALQQGRYPEELQARLRTKVREIFRTQDSVWVLFRDGLVRKIPDRELLECARSERLRACQERLGTLRVCGGGHALNVDDAGEVPAEQLRMAGREASMGADVFRAYMRQNLLSTAEAADILCCSRQNIQDLVRRGRLVPVMELGNTFLFTRGDIEELSS